MFQNLKLYIKMIWWGYKMKAYMNLIGKKARKACLEKVKTQKKNKILKRYISLIEKEKNLIFSANKIDIKFALKKKIKN